MCVAGAENMKYETAYFGPSTQMKATKIISLVPIVALIIVFFIHFEMSTQEYERFWESRCLIALGLFIVFFVCLIFKNIFSI